METDTKEQLDKSNFNSLLQGFYVKSFKFSQGNSELQIRYNVMFVRWLMDNFDIDFLKEKNPIDIIEDIKPPSEHSAQPDSDILDANYYAKRSLEMTYNWIVKDDKRKFSEYIEVDRYDKLKFDSHDPGYDLTLSDMELLKLFIAEFQTIDKIWIKRIPRRANKSMYLDYLINGSLLAGHPFFSELFNKARGILKC